MSQKTKAIILIVIILILTVGMGIYIFKKNKAVAPASQTMNSPQLIEQSVTSTEQLESAKQTPVQDKKESTIEGKVRSINEKQIYIELTDGSGSAINIEPTVIVRSESDDKIGNLSILKPEATVSVKVDENNNALEILIKK